MVRIELRSSRSAACISDVIGCGISRSIAGPEIDGTRRLVHFVKIMRNYIAQHCYERQRSHQQRSKVPKNTLHRRFCKKSGAKVQQKNDICKRKAGKICSVAIFTHFLKWDPQKSLTKVLFKSY